MNESETRAELIDPALAESGWGSVPDTKVHREFRITDGKIQVGGKRANPLIADYILSYKNTKLAVIEAKSNDLEVGEGVAQAKQYAAKLHLDYAYAANGREVYQINMSTGEESLIPGFPTPDEIWSHTHGETQDLASPSLEWRQKFHDIPFERVDGRYLPRFYQEIAVNKTLAALAEGKNRILLTLATGTGKTIIAFQIAWKLFYSRWNLKRDGSRRPRILFLADRNILANQAYNAFSAFTEDARVRIAPDEIRKKGKVPTNGSIFFTIFQTFMSGGSTSSPTDKVGNKDFTVAEPVEAYFGEYPSDFFDFIIIDECHRGGANDESNWRAIMEYFSPAVQLGLTATPKRKDNVDTYAYFGEPVYVYSLKEGINDGFLTPFKVKRIQTTLDEYVYTSDDTIMEGEVEEGKVYEEKDFNRIISIKAREEKRVRVMLTEINQNEKTIVFCATQAHAAAIRDLINQLKDSTDPNYCQRVTANDGKLGEQHLKAFQDNEKTIPTILTTSQKLSTGVDARNIRNIVLIRPVNTMIEFKQIIGRGTRLYEGKEFFTLYDYVGAYHHFLDPEWDGEPEDPIEHTDKVPEPVEGAGDTVAEEADTYGEEKSKKRKIRIKLGDGKEREIQHMIATSFWSPDGKPISSQEFMQELFGKLPEYFSDEAELRRIWSDPATRKAFLTSLEEAGYNAEVLTNLQELINAQNSDLFDVLEYVSYAVQPITREERVTQARPLIFKGLEDKQIEFLEFVLSQYIETGVGELDQEKLPSLLELKYHSVVDAAQELGGVDSIRQLFIAFQRKLYGGV